MNKDTENLKKLAEEGSSYAQYVLSSEVYTEGDKIKIEPDSKKAFFWRKKAAEQGHITSQFESGGFV